MTPTPRIDARGVPWCSPDCPAYSTRRCEIDRERVEDGAVCLPRVREMARMIEAARCQVVRDPAPQTKAQNRAFNA